MLVAGGRAGDAPGTSQKVVRFWAQHLAKVVAHHPGAAAGCWEELMGAAVTVHALAAQ